MVKCLLLFLVVGADPGTAFVEADELAEDLLVLLADGLTEERLVALLTRWSKAWRRKPSGGPKEMDQLD